MRMRPALFAACGVLLVSSANAVALHAPPLRTGSPHTWSGAAAPAFSIRDTSIVEGNSGTATMNFLVTLSDIPAQAVSVQYQTADGTATTADNDYVPAAGTLTLAPVSAQYMLGWGSYGIATGQFWFPEHIALDDEGYVYVADRENQRVQKFDPIGGFVLAWGSGGTGDGQFNDVRGITVSCDGFVYVTDTGNHRVQKFDRNGAFLLKWGSQGTGNGQFNAPYGINASIPGEVYVVDQNNARIQVFDPTGAFLRKWGSAGSGNGQLSSPFGITVDWNNYVYVTENGNSRVQKFDWDGTYLTQWGSWGSGDGQFVYPDQIAIGLDGTLYVACIYQHRIQAFDTNGVFLGKWGRDGFAPGDLHYPIGVAVGANDDIYVCEQRGCRVQKFRPAPPSGLIGVTINGDATVESDETFSVTLSGAAGAGIARGTASGVILNDDVPVGVNAPPRADAPLALLGTSPARDVVRFQYEAAAGVRVELTIHDLTGRCVATLVRDAGAPGRHVVEWRGEGAVSSAGVFVARLALGDRVVTRKFVRTR